jgi:hypothetical protein
MIERERAEVTELIASRGRVWWSRHVGARLAVSVAAVSLPLEMRFVFR